MTDFPAQDLYQIGSVTALTGIAAERLRAWERRYGFAPAERNGKIRLYSHEQVKKLNKIKKYVSNNENNVPNWIKRELNLLSKEEKIYKIINKF